MSVRAAQKRADQAVNDALQAHWDGHPEVVLDAGCGAGKSTTLQMLAAQAYSFDERVLLGCQTNEQMLDLALKLARRLDVPVHVMARADLAFPDAIRRQENIERISSIGKLDADDPCIVLSNLHKIAWVWKSPRAAKAMFDTLFIDEAYQATYSRLLMVRDLAPRLFLVGDPGQIDPFVTCSTERWQGEPGAVQLPAPRALLEHARAEGRPVHRLTMPISRRLPNDSAAIVADGFYTDMGLESLAAPGDRGFSVDTSKVTGAFADQVVERLQSTSMVFGELPAQIVGPRDHQMLQTVVDVIDRLRDLGCVVHDDGGEGSGPLTADQVGVVVPHSDQVAQLQAALSARWPGVLVETANRFQGLERAVIVAVHPLSGLHTADAFHSDAGRLCVALSRHRVGCIVLGRAGIATRIEHTPYGGDRAPEEAHDAEWAGRRAQMRVLGELLAPERRVRA